MLNIITWNHLSVCKQMIELFALDNNNWNHFTVYKQMGSVLFKNNVTYKLFAYKSYMYKQDLALNKAQDNKQYKPNVKSLKAIH